METVNLRDQYKEALSYHNMLRSLKFKPEDIYVNIIEGELCVLVRPEAPIGFPCGKLDISTDQFIDEWNKAVVAWNKELTDKQQRNIYLGSNAFSNKLNVVRVLVQEKIL